MKNLRVLLDLRGLVIACWKGGEPRDFVRNEKGEKIPSAAHAVDRFIDNVLMKILDNYPPIQIIGVLDGGNQRRRAIFPAYKLKPSSDEGSPIAMAERDKAYVACQKLLLALGALLVKTPTVEADDTIAYLVERLPGAKFVHTVDADLLQLTSDQCRVFLKGTMTEEYEGMHFDEISPRLVTLYKSIIGDKSDEYPGVKGMGAVAWQKLVEEYGYDGMLELDDCVRNTDYKVIESVLNEAPNKHLQKLYDSRHEWRTMYQLASLHPNWCETAFAGKIVRPQWGKRVPTMDRLLKVLEPLGLKLRASQFQKYMIKRLAVDEPMYKRLQMPTIHQQMKDSMFIAFDYESFDKLKNATYKEARSGYVDVLSQEITGCSFCFGDNLQYSMYMSVNHRDTANLPMSAVTEILNAVDDKESEAELVAHNASFEMTVTLTNLKKKFNRQVLDTRVMSSYADENQSDGLKDLSQAYLNYVQTTYNEVVPEDGDMRDVSLPEVLVYGCDDSICTAHLFVLFQTIAMCERTWEFYRRYEPAFDRVMLPSFIEGVEIDYDRLLQLQREDEQLRERSLGELRAMLREKCSTHNMAGFETLWDVVSPYERERLQKSGKSPENVEAELEEKKQRVLDSCRYRDLETPSLNWNNKSCISKISKSLGLPGLRGNKQEWVLSWVHGLRQQSVDQDIPFTQLQDQFLTLLEAASGDLKLGGTQAFDDLAEFCQGVLESDEEMWVGDELNIDSPPQMGALFYGKMNLPILLRNIDKKGTNKRTQWDLEQSPSTDAMAIDTWMAEINDEEDWRYYVLKRIKTLRGISTRFKLYYKPYPLFRSPIDGRMHPQIKNCGTITRRPSGSSPNILQVSKIWEEGRMRTVYLPLRKNHLIVSIDFVQQELVILAGESNDKNLRSCYQGDNRRDVHSFTGTGIFNVEQAREGRSSVSYEQYIKLLKEGHKEAVKVRKKKAKTTNFLMAYGGSAGGLARKIIVPRELAKQYIGAFFDTYPRVEVYQESRINFAKIHGYVLTCFGNRKHCTGILAKDSLTSSAWERQAINAPIQSGAADVLKVLMEGIDRTELLQDTGAIVIAPVYDEIVSSVPDDTVYEYSNRLADLMEMELPGLNIGLTTSLSVGRNWGDQIELGTRPSRELVDQVVQMLRNNVELTEIRSYVDNHS